MARFGISKQEVFAAANHLVDQGKDPTIEQIRQILKTGSNSTIAGHLRDWRAAQCNNHADPSNEGIPREMVSMLKGLWERLSTQAEMEVTAAEAKHQETTVQLEQELQKYRANNRRWQRLFLQWQQEREKLTTDKIVLEQGISLLQQDKSMLQAKLKAQAEQLQEKRLRIEELHRLHEQFQANFEVYQKQHSSEQIRYIEQAEKAKRQLVAAQQDYKLLLQRYEDLNDRYSVIEQALNEQQKEAQTNKHWQHQYQDTQKLLDNKINQLIEVQTALKLTASQLAAAQEGLNKLQEQNKHLELEKNRLEKQLDDAVSNAVAVEA